MQTRESYEKDQVLEEMIPDHKMGFKILTHEWRLSWLRFLPFSAF